MMLLIISMNSLFAGDGIACWATRWLTVATALRRPNKNAVEALRVERFEERVRRRGPPWMAGVQGRRWAGTQAFGSRSRWRGEIGW